MLAWIDLEMTGLDPGSDVIVEIATLVTDDDLEVIAEGPALVVHQPPEVLDRMGEYVRAMHTKSGLLEAIAASSTTLAEAGEATLAFLREHLGEPGTVPLCGNSLGTDRRFLAQWLPEVYGGRELLPVAREIRRALPKAMKLLPDKVMATSASALEAAILTQELDEQVTDTLGNALDEPLTEMIYLKGFRQENHREARQRQLQLVAELGHHLDRYIRSRMIQTTFRMVRKPAHAAGFANLYDFMDRSFRVMKPVPSVGLLLEQLAAREETIMQKVYHHHPAPFED